MLQSFKEKLNAPKSKLTRPANRRNPGVSGSHISTGQVLIISLDVESTTPEGSPAPNYNPFSPPSQHSQPPNGSAASMPMTTAGQPAGQTAPDTSSILKALADMAKQNTTAPPGSSAPAPANPFAAFNTATTASQPAPSSTEQATQQAQQAQQTQQPQQAPQAAPAANPFAAGNPFAALTNLAQSTTPQQTPTPSALPNPLAALFPQAATAQPAAQAQPTGISPETLQQVQLLQLLAAQGIPQEQWATALQLLTLTNSVNNMNAASAATQGFNAAASAAQPAWGARPDTSRDADRDRDRDRERSYGRSPPGQYRRRSRSPGWDRRREPTPPRRRDSPVYGEYHGDSPSRRGGGDPRGRRGNEYRQRSPPGRRRRTPSPQRKDPSLPPPGPKRIEWDYSIGPGNIKVLSRTLFVGGVT